MIRDNVSHLAKHISWNDLAVLALLSLRNMNFTLLWAFRWLKKYCLHTVVFFLFFFKQNKAQRCVEY